MAQTEYNSLFPELDNLPRQKSKEEVFHDYDGFVDKFKSKKTTDDCFTPPEIYQAVFQWVNDNIMKLSEVPVVRPFFPGGNFEAYAYPANCVVLDNPPFSILARIRRFYHARGIRYFLFAPALTLANSARELPCTYIISGESIIYENGAQVSTSFVTNLDCGDVAVWCAGSLSHAIKLANKGAAGSLPVYTYPHQVTTSALLQKIAKAGGELKINKQSLRYIGQMDAQKHVGKAIYGGGWLLSEKAAAEKAAAEKAAAEKAYIWKLSDREKKIIDALE